MLTAAIFIPLAGAVLLALLPSRSRDSDPGAAGGAAAVRALGALVAAVPLALLVAVWLAFDPAADPGAAAGAAPAGDPFRAVVDVPWIPAVGVGYRVGVDGISLVVATMSALLYVVAVAWPMDHRGRAREYVAWMLFLESVSIGLFVALDLLLFYVFFDLSLVGMYFLIGVWGHEDRQRAALKFILFTLAGSLVMLLGILSLALAHDPITFDLRTLTAAQPLAGGGLRAALTLLALLFGLAIKTPLVPVHTWLPAAHVEAPAPASAILAGVLLKMGTYGMIRIAWAPMRDTFQAYAFVLGVFAVVSIVYGAFVALGQRHIKRRIAYTSITHMGYTVLGIAMAASITTGHEAARRLALTGATLEMVAHGLITGALFLVAGSLWQRGHSFDMGAYGGLAGRVRRLTAAAVVASFASLGLPGLAGFVAEFQIFTGAVAIEPWFAGIGLIGVLVTAALFLQLLQEVFLGAASDRTAAVGAAGDLGAVETVGLALLLGLTVLLGVAPAFAVDVIAGAAEALLGGPAAGPAP